MLWLAGLVLAVIGIALFCQRVSAWRESAKLITDGIPIDAEIYEVDGFHVPGRALPGDKPVTLHFQRDGELHEIKAPYVDGRLPEEPLTVGKTLKIRIDPADPNRWTPRQSPTPLGPELLGGSIVLGTALLLFLLAAVVRLRLIRTLRMAPQIDVVVLSARHSAIAPRAWQVRCSPTADGDNRVFSVYVPPKTEVANVTLRLLIPAHGRPLAMEWFE